MDRLPIPEDEYRRPLGKEPDICPTCGGDREGALFKCPHCGAGALGPEMTLTEDEEREYEYARRAYRAEQREGLLRFLVRSLLRLLSG